MAVCTLGLGMALCATTLAVLDAYLLRDLSYPGAERLYSDRIRPAQPEDRPATWSHERGHHWTT